MNAKSISSFQAALLAVALLATSPVSAGKLDKVESFSINPKVDMPEKARFVGASTIAPGLISELLGGSDKPPEAALNEVMQKHKIDVGQIIVEKLTAAFQNSSFASKLSDSSTSQLTLRVNEYGLAKVPGTLKNSMQPFMSMQAEIKNEKGKTLLKKSVYMKYAYFKSLPVNVGDFWFQHPEKIAEVFGQVAELQSADLLDGL